MSENLFKKDIYHCNQCKKLLDSLGDLLFVEDGVHRGFCSEDCIETYYSPIVQHYEYAESQLRKEKSLLGEDALELVGNHDLIDALSMNPDEIWIQENDIGESIFTFSKKVAGFIDVPCFVVMKCFLFEKEPSYVIFSTVTASEEMKDDICTGEKIEDPKDFLNLQKEILSELNIDSEDIEELERKKSYYLANILEERKEVDIPVENFHLYEDYVASTLEEPDEVYSYNDDEGDLIHVHIKAQDNDGTSFYFFVLTLILEGKGPSGEDFVLPIISFPSIDGDIYHKYCAGDKLQAPLKN